MDTSIHLLCSQKPFFVVLSALHQGARGFPQKLNGNMFKAVSKALRTVLNHPEVNNTGVEWSFNLEKVHAWWGGIFNKSTKMWLRKAIG